MKLREVEVNAVISLQTNVEKIKVQIQNELQSIPTVEQGKEAFINNVQAMHEEKKEEKAETKGENVEEQSYTSNTKQVSNLEKTPREKALAENKKYSLIRF